MTARKNTKRGERKKQLDLCKLLKKLKSGISYTNTNQSFSRSWSSPPLAPPPLAPPPLAPPPAHPEAANVDE